jgi:hypothetical protein
VPEKGMGEYLAENRGEWYREAESEGKNLTGTREE